MCGFLAVFQRSAPVDAERLREATARLTHRGPDASGICVFSSSLVTPEGLCTLSAGFGHRRLSILDLDARSNQPFCSDEGVLVYNGEIYNFREVRRTLIADGVRPFLTEGDTEVLHRLLTTSGEEAVTALNGMWAFCFYDRSRNRVVASRDRFGKKPLFVYRDADVICLASEAKAILTYLGGTVRASSEGVVKFLAYGMLHPSADGATFIEGIREVPAGHTLTIALPTWTSEERRYFDLASSAATCPPPDLGDVLDDAIRSRLVSDRPVALLLSGGVDSGLILSVLAAAGLHEQVRCFVGRAAETDDHDADYALQSARAAGIVADEIDCRSGATQLDHVVRMCAHHEKPFPLLGNSVAMSHMYAAISERGIPVVMDGTGADEVFGGYWDRYYRFALSDAVRADDSAWIDATWAATRVEPRLARWVGQARDGVGAPPHRCPISPTFSRFARDPAVPDCDDPLCNGERTLAAALIADASAGGRLAEWIWHNDRNAMMYGLENRSPFLDWRLVPFIGSGYARKFVGCFNKHELRVLYSRFLSLPSGWRHQKQGFHWTVTPFIVKNKSGVLDLVASSRLLDDVVELPRYVAMAKADDRVLQTELTPRLLCIAALEQAMALRGLT